MGGLGWVDDDLEEEDFVQQSLDLTKQPLRKDQVVSSAVQQGYDLIAVGVVMGVGGAER